MSIMINSVSEATFNKQDDSYFQPTQQPIGKTAHADCGVPAEKDPAEDDAPLEQNVMNLECNGV